MKSDTTAIVLAGGRSRRLGQDKRMLRLAGPRTQLEETVERLQHVAGDVIIAGGLELASEVAHPVRWVADATADAGPLAGLVAGLAAARHEFALVVACDLPLLDCDLLKAMVDWPRDYDLLVPRRHDGTLEMLHAIYRTRCLPLASRRLAGGELKLAGLAHAAVGEGLTVRYLDDDQLSRLNPGMMSFFNVNTPAELEKVQSFIAGKR